MKRKGGTRRKSRSKLTRPPRKQGKKDITSYLERYEEGDNVVLDLDPSVHDGYTVEINDKGKDKTIIAHPVHLTTV